MPSRVEGSLAAKLEIAHAGTERMLRDVAWEVSKRMARYARENAPVQDADDYAVRMSILRAGPTLAKIPDRKPGTLRDSITTIIVHKSARGGYIGGAVASDPIASIVEFGSRPHVIRPTRQPGLRRSPSGKFVRFARALRWADVAAGGPRFATEVHHPGTKPTHFMGRARERVRAEIPGVGTTAVIAWLRESGLRVR